MTWKELSTEPWLKSPSRDFQLDIKSFSFQWAVAYSLWEWVRVNTPPS